MNPQERAKRRHGRDQRGAVAIEFLLVISMLIAVFLVMLQYAVRAHAERIAFAAASEGLAAAANYNGSAATGRTTAQGYLTRLGPGLNSTRVVATRTGTTASITVSGRVDQLIPFLSVHVHVYLTGPVERFVPESP